jgi:glycerol-3-phosphate cytidylyltransferase
MIIYTGGSFDLFHIGHLELLDACHQLAGPDGRVVVSLNTDEFIEAYKGRPPVQSYAVRAEVLRACRFVDLVVANVGGADSRVAIDVVRPHLLAIGDDWLDPPDDERRYQAQLGVTPEWLAERGLRIVYVPRTRGTSTTRLRDYLEEPEPPPAEPPRPSWRVENGRVVHA